MNIIERQTAEEVIASPGTDRERALVAFIATLEADCERKIEIHTDEFEKGIAKMQKKVDELDKEVRNALKPKKQPTPTPPLPDKNAPQYSEDLKARFRACIKLKQGSNDYSKSQAERQRLWREYSNEFDALQHAIEQDDGNWIDFVAEAIK